MIKVCFLFYVLWVCSLFSYFSSIFKKWKIVVFFSVPFTFLTLRMCLQDFCIVLFPITRTCCSFSEDCLACRLIEPTLPTGSERQKGLGVYISLKWLNQWVGWKSESPSPFSSDQDCSEFPWGPVRSYPLRDFAQDHTLASPLPSVFYFLHSLPVSIGRTFFINYSNINSWLKSVFENNLMCEMGLYLFFSFSYCSCLVLDSGL